MVKVLALEAFGGVVVTEGLLEKAWHQFPAVWGVVSLDLPKRLARKCNTAV
jgi:hypothetical protein